jgi:CheY-like chemotaxis protein
VFAAELPLPRIGDSPAPGADADGAQAVEAFRTGRWDVVLMDIQMPVMDGIEAGRAIRALERGQGAARTPMVALTANAMPDEVADYRAAGFDDHLSKPIDTGELLAVLNRALAGYVAVPVMEVA